MKKTAKIGYMSAVAEDLIKTKFKPNMTLRQAQRKFFQIMRKHGIAQGTKTGKGISVSNYEWTMAKELFLSSLMSYLQMSMFFIEFDKMPKDLECYNKEK